MGFVFKMRSNKMAGKTNKSNCVMLVYKVDKKVRKETNTEKRKQRRERTVQRILTLWFIHIVQ